MSSVVRKENVAENNDGARVVAQVVEYLPGVPETGESPGLHKPSGELCALRRISGHPS